MSLVPERLSALRGARATVMGLGSFGGGAGAARYLAESGLRVTVTDLRGPEELADSLAALADVQLRTVLGEHRRADFEEAALVVANPAVAPDHPLLRHARASGARITSAIELLLEALPARAICVTGTQGKSTTCHLVAHFLSAAGRRVHVGGNLGGSLLPSVARLHADDVVVLELSSYQLEALGDPGGLQARVPLVAVTNVLSDHLERHGTRARYGAAKARILELLAPGGTAILPAADAFTADWRPRTGRRVDLHGAESDTGLAIAGGRFLLDGEELGRVADLPLKGAFQAENALRALGLARLLDTDPEALARALPSARGLEHRLQRLGTYAGREVWDNAVSTTPDSTVAALRAVPEGCTLLLGGRAKNLPIDELAALAAQRAALVVTFGESRARLSAALTTAGARVRAEVDVPAAVGTALAQTATGRAVLFSPACASFDAYPNFLARARAFRDALPEPDADHPA